MVEEEKAPEPHDKEQEEETSSSASTLERVQKIEQAADRLESENRRLEENISKIKLLQAEQQLEGKSIANAPAAKDSDEDYAEKALKGEVGNDKEND